MEIDFYINSIGSRADYFIHDKVNPADNMYREMSENNFRMLLAHVKMEMLCIGGIDPLRHTNIHGLLDIIPEYMHIKYLKIYVSSIDDENTWTRLIELRKKLENVILYFAPHEFPSKPDQRLRQSLQRGIDDNFEIQLLVSISPDAEANQKIVSSCKELKIKNLLWFLPCHCQSTYAKEYYESYRPPLHAFLKSTTLNRIRTTAFCHSIPYCLLNRDELMTFALSGHNLEKAVCDPVIHIMPDLKINLCNLCECVFDPNAANQSFFLEMEKLKQDLRQLKSQKLFETCEVCKMFQLKQVSCGCNFIK